MMAYVPGSPSAYNPAGSTADNGLYQRSVSYIMDPKNHGKAFALVGIGIFLLWLVARRD